MSFIPKNVANYMLYDTCVDNLFITEYMPSAPGDYVKTYLYALMRTEYSLPTDDESLTKGLGLSLAEVEEAWDYWEDQGLVKKRWLDPDAHTRFEREFADIRGMVFGRGSGRSESEKSSTPRAVSLEREQLAKLYRDIEAVTGRMLESREPETVASWIGDYGIDPQVIVFGYKFCRERGRSDRSRYVGTILKDWRAKGLMTVAQVEEFLSGIDKHYSLYKQVFKELGFNRNPSEPEKRIMDSWFDEMGFSMEQVLKACGKTTGIGNPNLNYVNAILVSEYNSERDGAKPAGAAKSADQIYEAIREENARKTEQKREEVFTKVPRMRTIMEEIRASGQNLSRLIVAGGKDAAESERRRLRDLNAEKAALLAENGFDGDALDMIYTCSDCKDTGVLDDGTRCHCYAEKARLMSGR